tara:strand:+ start:7361 stop:8401 length:1041 start_codon:yes stop_codon:yes gene_type:complete
MSSQPLRVGVVGAGGNSRLRHIPGFRQIENVEIAGVANRSRESGEAAAREFGIPKVFDDWQALVADPDIDAVCIGTWPNMHCDVTVAALEAGKHVLCEARMARDLREARRMMAAAEKHPELVAQIVPSPFTLGVDDWIADLLVDEVLGDLLELRVRFLNGSLRDADAPMNWRINDELSGKNAMVMGILHEAILRWLKLPDLQLLATAGFGSGARPLEDGAYQDTSIPESLQIVGHPSAGPRLLYDLSQLYSGPSENSIRICGALGSIEIDLVTKKVTLAIDGKEPEVREIEDAWDVEGEFVRSIRNGDPVTKTSFADGLEYMAFTEAVWRSWTSGSPAAVSIEEQD